jgi:hypothetical protein
MYVLSIHSVADPDAFGGAQPDLPEGTELPISNEYHAINEGNAQGLPV